MINLETAVKNQKNRTGKIDGITCDGRFWLACDPILIKNTGNGWDKPEVNFELQLRHFEDDKVGAVITETGRCNRNDLSWEHDYPLSDLLKCCSVEGVVVGLKRGVLTKGTDQYGCRSAELTIECYSDYFFQNLEKSLLQLGLPEALPGPDEIAGAPHAG